MTERRLGEFSLQDYYRSSRGARILNLLLILLLIFFILYTPLPFGSVQSRSILIIELFAGVCLLLWIVKLTLCCRQDQLKYFRSVYQEERERFLRQPFFSRHYWLARVFRFLTAGRWPRRFIAENLVQDSQDQAPHRLAYFSLFGYPVKNNGLELPAILFLALLVIQLVPMPSLIVQILSPSTAGLYRSAAEASGSTIAFYPVSVDPFATLSRLMLYLSYFILYVVVTNNIRTRAHFHVILYAIFISAVFQGLYGLYEFLSGNQHIFQYAKKYGLDSATGTFINRNHFAAYLELSLPLLLSLAVGRIEYLKRLQGNFFARLGHAFETEGSQVLLILLLVVLVSVSLIFSLSRSGIAFSILAVLMLFFLYRRSRGYLTRKSYWFLGIAATMALVVWIGLNPLLERFLQISENWQQEGARWQVWVDTFRIFLRFPLLGSGAGTYEQIFPVYRSFVTNFVYVYAHNDYLQILAETGIFSLILLIAFFDLLLERIRKIMSHHMNRLSIIQMAAFCSLFSLALHSVTDFGVQIPAIAILGAIVTGLYFGHYHQEHRNAH